ncbi:hypothetical protein [Phytohabitans houttuyneae]|jgi:hypothetical protein|uniref:PE domain-containing protein n=1 Tax=Phytohabitans houttuyneae TaxID=1076126 RepID=A0A6V8K797_9ACTN|nr:hypothetical protein [Phytohabitans houttuyneae]GFJ81082.1 hypothetical protein Phou_052620 [Phytohabitans houttuyneae]
MINPCFADKYLAYAAAARMAQMALARARAKLDGLPDLGARAAATTFTSPASLRLKADVTDVGSGIGDARARLGELIAYLATVADKYERLGLEADAARKKLEADG